METTALTTSRAGEVQRANSEPTTAELIRAAISSPEIDPARLNAFLEFKLKVDAIEAEKQFNVDFSQALLEMPKVVKRGLIEMGAKGSMKFATYDDVDAAIRPVEAAHGFARSFSTAPTTDGILMTLHLMHRGGHEKTSTMQMPPDSGAGRNGMQARGSAASYAKRYLTLDCWNVVTTGQDNDGSTAECITKEQADQIRDLLFEMSIEADDEKFLKYAEAKTVAQIQKHNFERVIKGLESKRRKAGAA